MNADDVKALLRWVNLAESDAQRAERSRHFWDQVSPASLPEDERKRRQAIIDASGERPPVPPATQSTPQPEKRKGRKRPDYAELTAVAKATPALGVEVRPREEWQGLVTPGSSAHRRGAQHDGTLREVMEMQREAEGSPFDVDAGADEDSPPRARRFRWRAPAEDS